MIKTMDPLIIHRGGYGEEEPVAKGGLMLLPSVAAN